LTGEQIGQALQRRVILAAIVFAVVVPVPVLAVLFVLLTGQQGVAAAGILLMAISPGAPVALRRAIDVGGSVFVAPALHLAIVLVAVITVPLSVAILDLLFGAAFRITPAEVARQILVAQLIPLGIGAFIRAFMPDWAAWLEPRLARLAGVLLVALLVVSVIGLRDLLLEVGWAPFVGGVILTVCALAIGSAFAGRDGAIRRQAAIAAAMRNPGLALLIASVNNRPPGVTAAIVNYALGATLVVTAYIAWQNKRTRAQ
jgi:predicted Na+-dependent transporter